MKRPNCTIGVDIGTTSAKVIALSASGFEIARATQRLEMISTEEGMAEQNPAHVSETVTQLLAQVAAEVRRLDYEISAVGFSAAMHSLLPIGVNGEPLCNAFTWLDSRAKEAAHAIWETNWGRVIYGQTGTPVHAMSPLSKLVWLRAQFPKVFLAAKRFVSLKEWVWFQWFREWCIDESMASATGLFHLTSRDWDADALAVAHITPGHLSRLVPTSYTRSGIQNVTLLDAGITADVPFNIGASDGVLANLAAGVTDSNAMVLTVGTSLALRCGSKAALVDASFRPFCYVLDEEHYIVGGPSNSGGIVLDWLYRDILSQTSDMDEEEFVQLCKDAKTIETDNLFCVPHVSGERAPIWNENATASFVGLRLHHKRVHLVRAAIEGIVFNAYSIAIKLFSLVGKPQYIVASGKLFEHEWVRQFVANVFGVPIRFQKEGDASTVGAIILANSACSATCQESDVKRDEQGNDVKRSQLVNHVFPADYLETAVQQALVEKHQMKYKRYQQVCSALSALES